MLGGFKNNTYLCNVIRKHLHHDNNLKHTIMTLSEFKNGLPPYMVNGKYDGTIDLLTEWDGYSDITSDMADGYNCTLGNVISTLDNMGINHDLECSDTGYYIRISVCR